MSCSTGEERIDALSFLDGAGLFLSGVVTYRSYFLFESTYIKTQTVIS